MTVAAPSMCITCPTAPGDHRNSLLSVDAAAICTAVAAEVDGLVASSPAASNHSVHSTVSMSLVVMRVVHGVD